MPTLKDQTAGKYIKGLVYGRSKIGKTFGAGTFPRPNFMDCDAGIGTLTGKDFIEKHGFRGDIIYEQFRERNLNPRGVPLSANAFDDACLYFDKWMRPGERDKFDTWVIDTGTTLSQFAMNKAIVLLGGSFKGIKSETQKQGVEHGLVFPKIQDYGSERSMVEQFIAMVKSADKNVLFLCHEKELTDEEGNVKAIVPLLTGKGVEAISLMFDEVWNVRVKKQGTETIRYLQTTPEGGRMVGSRTALPNGTPWDYDSIKKAMDITRAEVTRLSQTTQPKVEEKK